jgi:hypothetical protein
MKIKGDVETGIEMDSSKKSFWRYKIYSCQNGISNYSWKWIEEG